VLTCPTGQIVCGGFCVDPLTDESWCGASGSCTGIYDGTVCGASESCIGGVCQTISTPTAYPAGGAASSYTQSNYLRGNYYYASSSRTLTEFTMHIDRSGSCTLDFYVHSSTSSAGTSLTPVWSRQVAVGAGSGFVSSGAINITTTPGNYYYLSVAWNCTTTSYMSYDASLIGTNVGFGTLSGWCATNSYPGYSTSWAATLSTYTSGAYDQILYVL
jgi:hypothetical protein